MDAQSSRWNDDRLDEFAANVDRRFEHVDRRFDKVDREIGRVNDRLDDLMKVLIVGFIGLIGVVLAGVFALIAMQL